MSGNKEDKAASNSNPDEKKNQMLFNIVDKEERSKRYPADEGEEDKMNEFNTWAERYNQVSREIRKNAIDQEKRELENLEKSPLVRYYQGSRIERIRALDEEQKQLKKMDRLKFTKGKE